MLAQIINRGGKARGKYANRWNILDTRTGEETAVDFGDYNIKRIGKVKNVSENSVEIEKEDGEVVKVGLKVMYPYRSNSCDEEQV